MKKFILLFVLFFALLASAYVYWFYYNVFSDGTREGQMIKFSRKGNIFKTHEGELVQLGFRSGKGSVNTNNFFFSVCDPAIADSLGDVIGMNVKVHYTQYRKALPWRGENYNDKNQENGQYIIDRIENVTDPRQMQGGQYVDPTQNYPMPAQ